MKIDLSKDYFEKKIKLSEISEVQYVCMNENEDFLYEGAPRYISDNVFVFYSEGEFIFFTKDGEPKSKFNHQGNGPGEYSYFSKILYDEAKDELFVLAEKKILVYSSSGEYKRSIFLSLPDNHYVKDITIFDDSNLLLYDTEHFVLISKIDGSELSKLDLSLDRDIQLSISTQNEYGVSVIAGVQNTIVRYKEGFLLSDFTNDTIFYYIDSQNISPFLIKEPSVETMDPVIYANAFVEAGGYRFYRKVTVIDKNGRFPSDYLMQSIEDGSVYKQCIEIDDFIGKYVNVAPEVLLSSKYGFVELDLIELSDAYKKGLLKGDLKELMSKMDQENGNNIYMLLTFK